ncbi:protein PTHB1 isoform X2 [Eurytemora carolleeae]|uniref:protein PTHB1 isoform X2 n=1 Tax=Eurytemora carolleeae TaxID=1294199 RepID=UPI000C779A1C|nr:protein PTHB1 isoform X2 [Eurytemora carolleeae]|eukprot:XP_023334278.1 protein PTHB1-like isoform X2 [Eurytemora affinis]
METLTQRTAQFRAIERRLLTRFKDKTPVPLTNLDMLLEGTYKQVLLSCDQVESMHRDLDKSSANLSCIIRLLLMLAKLSLGLDDAELEKLEAALPPVIQTGQDQGWEETTDAGLTFLLRTALAKAGRENQGATPITLEYPKEISRLKKHVSSVMDRINKGSKVQDINVLPDSSPFVHEVIKDDSFDTEALEVVGRSIPEMTPAGTRFGESGERIRSARIRSARSARSARSSSSRSSYSRPTTSSSMRGQAGDIPPDGPVDLEELERNLPPLLPQSLERKNIESPAEIFATPAAAEDDIW